MNRQEFAKTLSFYAGPQPILIVAAGDVKIDNKKYKQEFGTKAKMISFQDVEKVIGHAPGGVCPFAVNRGVKVYLDQSLKRFQTVFPAAGSGNSAIEMNYERAGTVFPGQRNGLMSAKRYERSYFIFLWTQEIHFF